MTSPILLGAIVACLLAGAFFTVVSTVGLIRLPDLYSRTHTASQADTLGAGFTLAGVALADLVLGLGLGTTIKAVLLLFFIFVTNPTAAHAIARAAHEENIEPWTSEDGRTDVELYRDKNTQHTATDGGQEE
jgi:multicomponent Na+:H+ antiporter subunit G